MSDGPYSPSFGNHIKDTFFPDRDLITHLASIEDDLGALIAAVSKSFSDYLTIGALPAPYYVLRLCELLRATGHTDLEIKFLDSWSKHFEGRSIGVTFVKLRERLQGLYRTTDIYESVSTP